MKKLLKKLCELNGISGNEEAVASYIRAEVEGYCECETDNLGNLICFKKGEKIPKNKVAFFAHMDEVGMIVHYINDDGSLKISPVGGVDSRVVFGRQVVVGEKKLAGIIGSKAVHNLTEEEKSRAVSFSEIYVDIGANSKEEAEKVVKLGDVVAFKSDFLEFGDGMIKSKALDDRAGCAIMIDMLKKPFKYDTYFIFTVQEEIGLRGAKASSYTVNPDIAVVLETTTAGDIPSVSDDKKVCEVNKGAVVSFMDRGTIYNKKLYDLAFETAKNNDIPCQTKTMIAGGNDSGAIHVSCGGVKTVAISVPCRYLHSPSTVFSYNDFMSVKNLANALCERLYDL